MPQKFAVGTSIGGRRTTVTVDAEDALIAALKVKHGEPNAVITYVRKHNARGDRRHPHPEATDMKTGSGKS